MVDLTAPRRFKLKDYPQMIQSWMLKQFVKQQRPHGNIVALLFGVNPNFNSSIKNATLDFHSIPRDADDLPENAALTRRCSSTTYAIRRAVHVLISHPARTLWRKQQRQHGALVALAHEAIRLYHVEVPTPIVANLANLRAGGASGSCNSSFQVTLSSCFAHTLFTCSYTHFRSKNKS